MTTQTLDHSRGVEQRLAYSSVEQRLDLSRVELGLAALITTLSREPGSPQDSRMKWVEAIEADILQTEVSPAQPASKTQSGQTPLTSGFSVLVVDDDVAILATISEILSFEGYPVQTATNGLEGLAAIDSYLPSLVLLDMRMPVLDGWGFAHAVRDRGYPIPIVVMTAAQDAQLWANEIGAAAVLPKPFNLDDLIEVVERFKTSES